MRCFYTVYDDDTTFFLKNKESIFFLVGIQGRKYKQFSAFSGLRLNEKKCKITDLGTLKVVKVQSPI